MLLERCRAIKLSKSRMGTLKEDLVGQESCGSQNIHPGAL